VRAHAARIEEQLVRYPVHRPADLSYFRDTPRRQTKDLVPLVELLCAIKRGLLEEKKIHLRKELPDILLGSVYPG